MRVVLLCRQGAPARLVANRLHEAGHLDAIVFEGGQAARKRKLARSWGRTPWWARPRLGVDLLALSLYGRAWRRVLDTRMEAAYPTYAYPPDGIPLLGFDDANDPACVSALRDLAPDVLVVYGTSILKEPVLRIADTSLNIHGGIVPAYRNVHSEVWAVLNGAPGDIGTSILHLDEGIDSGAVALQRRIEPATGDFFTLRWRNLELSAGLIVEALDRHEGGTLPAERQTDDGRVGFYPTPGWRELRRLRNWHRSRRD
ncbi:MAG: formyltransferase family protein [Gemmatimonadota bacterium]